MASADPRKKIKLVSVDCTPLPNGYLNWNYRLVPIADDINLKDYKPTFTAITDIANHEFSYPPTETIGQVVLTQVSGAGKQDGLYTEVLTITQSNAADLYHVAVEHAYISGPPPPTEDVEILNDPRKP